MSQPTAPTAPDTIPAPATGPKPKVYLAVLCYGGQVYWDWCGCILNLLTRTQLIHRVESIAGDSLVSRARNNLASQFLASDCTHLLFIDCDIVFEPWHVARLIQHDLPLVCGMYPLKQTRPSWVSNAVPGKDVDARGLLEVREAGTGFMLVHRSVFEQMTTRYPEIGYTKDDNEKGTHPRFDFFSVGCYTDGVTQRKRYLSEDYYFCQRWRDMGGSVVLDTRIRARHIGRATYPLEAAEVRAAAFHYDQEDAMESASAPDAGNTAA